MTNKWPKQRPVRNIPTISQYTHSKFASDKANQDEAYDHGYRSCEHRGERTYKNPYDSGKFWLLYMAYEQGWNDRAAWEREQATEALMDPRS